MSELFVLLFFIAILGVLLHFLNRIIPVYKVLRAFTTFLFPVLKNLFTFDKGQGARFQGRFEASRLLKSSNKGLLIDGKDKRLGADDSYKHCLLVAPTGGGKTTKYVIPNLLKLDNCSMIVTDPSGEIFEQVSDDLYRRGYHIQVLNPTNPHQSMQYNPLTKVGSVAEMGELAHVLVKSANSQDYERNAFWYRGAETLITIMMRCLANMHNPTQMHLPNVLYLLQHFNEGNLIDEFVMQYAPDTVFRQYKGLISGNQKTVDSYISTALNSLDMCNNPDIAKIFAGDEIDFSRMRRKKTALFLILPSERITYYSFLMNILYTQLFTESMRTRPSAKDLPIYCILDEAGHSAIPHLGTIMTSIRKFKVSISLILQSTSQLEHQYGKHESRTILEGGVGSKLFYAGVDLDTAKTVEQMLGRVKEKERGERNLMNADRITRMKSDQAIFFHGNQEPILCTTHPYYKQPYLARRTKRPPVDFTGSAGRFEVPYVDLRR